MANQGKRSRTHLVYQCLASAEESAKWPAVPIGLIPCRSFAPRLRVLPLQSAAQRGNDPFTLEDAPGPPNPYVNLDQATPVPLEDCGPHRCTQLQHTIITCLCNWHRSNCSSTQARAVCDMPGGARVAAAFSGR